MTYAALSDAMSDLISAVTDLGFDRAEDCLRAYGNEGDEDTKEWHGPVIDAVRHALDVARRADGRDPQARWLSVSPEPGQVITWDWHGQPDAAFAGVVLRSVERIVGINSREPVAHAELFRALPVMRRSVEQFLFSCAAGYDPNTITPLEFQEVEADIEAILSAQDVCGKVKDFQDVDTDFLDAAIAEYQRRQRANEAGE